MVEFYLNEVRTRKNISIRELSKVSGVAVSHIEKIESGTANPSVEIMCKLGQALEVPICELFRCEYDKRRKLS